MLEKVVKRLLPPSASNTTRDAPRRPETATQTPHPPCRTISDEQPVIFRRVVFQVGVLDHHDGCGRPGEPRAQRRAFALVLLMPHQGHPRIAARGRLQFFPSAVPGGIHPPRPVAGPDAVPALL